MKKPFYQLEQSRDVIRHFTPNWFTATMGTGVVAMILAQLPFASSILFMLATKLWQFNILLFITFSILYGLRWILFPTEAKQIFNHPNMSLFLGAIPMGLATIANGFLSFGVHLYGDIAVQIATYLWYLDVFFAVLIAWVVPFCMFSCQDHQLQRMTAVWLLPIVACEVAASSAGLLLQHLAADQHALAILIMGYVLWGISVLPAFAILTILMLRLALHQLPEKEVAISSWLCLGPIGTGAMALLLLGQQAPRILNAAGLEELATIVPALGVIGGLVLLGFGLWWFGIAVLTTVRHARTGIPFNLGWWGLTFPFGVFILAIFNLAHQLQFNFFTYIAVALSIVLLALWALVMKKTVVGAYSGQLFFSPCLVALQQKMQ
ncbi:TDT family transporter [Acinetobacter junii]|jgi:C4-dicarboxylate transporter/malic acid transport protein|uniref:TDT family transporter n=2 Tax=Acinetobacter junii TaxID=40215 RepID=A0AAW5RBK5_ACIJU|nr:MULTISPECIES: TDT family transporter [Acinetobacter]MBY3626834.1 TDT family transporter [Acinetobacter sp. CUI P1]EEY91566.1 C4-dicarboxylate transporter/malic acid transport protein [Acinetobacter junii SH205]MBL8281748.1 TDT family transporter [Acinetobacter junii]MCU4398098.1 TDT family transporter [Acinetobacter junii]MCU4406396.1 TDT family transporter [Acinetobacter junii]